MNHKYNIGTPSLSGYRPNLAGRILKAVFIATLVAATVGTMAVAGMGIYENHIKKTFIEAPANNIETRVLK